MFETYPFFGLLEINQRGAEFCFFRCH